jgi:hypothetical protein
LVPRSNLILAIKLLRPPVLMIFSILVAERAFSTSKEAYPLIFANKSNGMVVIRSFKKLKDKK